MLLSPAFHLHWRQGTAQFQRRTVLVGAGRRQQQQPKKRKTSGKNQPIEQRVKFVEAPEEDDDDDVQGNTMFVEAPMGPDGGLPRAPSPSTSPKLEPGSDSEDPPYPVFAAKGVNVKDAPWTWGEDAPSPSSSGPPLPEWNPRTGFMRSEKDIIPGSMSQASSGSSGSSSSSSSAGSSTGTARTAPVEPQISLIAPAADATADLPFVSQTQVMTSCLGTSFWMTLLALFLRSYAQANAPMVLGTDEKLLAEFLQLPPGLDNWTNAGVLVAAATVVTAARFQLMSVWPEFRQATERSNKQILGPLSWFDILLVALLTGASEELLFRGAIMPATFLDWRGVLISGLIFGLLHNSGGRNMAFAAWASGVGLLYGGAFLYTHNIWVPAAAHVLANFASAVSWKFKSEPSEKAL